MGSKKKGQEPRDGRESPPTPAAGCWMWQREGDDSWNKRWCKCTNKRLTVFASEQVRARLAIDIAAGLLGASLLLLGAGDLGWV